MNINLNRTIRKKEAEMDELEASTLHVLAEQAREKK